MNHFHRVLLALLVSEILDARRAGLRDRSKTNRLGLKAPENP